MKTISKQSLYRRLRHSDLAILLTLIWIYFFWFYQDWPIWNDQAIFQIGAFRFLSGQSPYHDFAIFHWPGTFLLHSLAYLISGFDPLGLRILDCTLLSILCCSSLTVFKSWGLPWHLRLLGIAPYIPTYFSQLYEQTAQREGLQLPILVTGLIPFLIKDRPIARWQLALHGIVAGFAFWFKPTCAVIILGVLTAYYCWSPRNSKEKKTSVAFFSTGFALISIYFIGWLKIHDGWAGFLHYSLSYVSDAYSSARDSFALIVRKFSIFCFGKRPFSSPAFYSFCVLALLIFTRTPIKSCVDKSARLKMAATIVMAALFQYFWQGKGWCYQLFPFQWGLCFLSATLLSIPHSNSFISNKFSKAFVLVAVFSLSLIPAYALSRIHFSRELPGVLLGQDLRTQLLPGESLISFSFNTMGVQMSSESLPPLLPIEPSVIYFTSPPNSPYKQEVLRQMHSALKNPQVRFLVTSRPKSRDNREAQDEFTSVLNDEKQNPDFASDYQNLRDGFEKDFEYAGEVKTSEYSHASYVIYQRKPADSK